MYNLLLDIGNTSCKAAFADVRTGRLERIVRYEEIGRASCRERV